MPEVAPTVLLTSDPDAITHAVLAMQAGGIVGIPTETVYGIGVVPRPEALAAVIRAKQRPEEKGIALLIDGLDQVDGLVELSLSARRLAERFWPGPLTLVLPLRHPELVPDGGHRWPRHAGPADPRPPGAASAGALAGADRRDLRQPQWGSAGNHRGATAGDGGAVAGARAR